MRGKPINTVGGGVGMVRPGGAPGNPVSGKQGGWGGHQVAYCWYYPELCGYPYKEHNTPMSGGPGGQGGMAKLHRHMGRPGISNRPVSHPPYWYRGGTNAVGRPKPGGNQPRPNWLLMPEGELFGMM